MNDLAVFIGEEYLMAGFQSPNGAFKYLAKDGNEKFHLFFNVNEDTTKITYNIDYQGKIQDNVSGYYGGFISKVAEQAEKFTHKGQKKPYVELLSCILQDIQDLYGQDNANTSSIITNLSFSDNISNNAKLTLKSYFEKVGFVIDEFKQSPAQLIVKQHINLAQKPSFPQRFLVLDAFGYSINMSFIEAKSANSTNRLHFKSYSGFGVEPKVQSIAQLIVNQIDSTEHILYDDASKELEYKRHATKARKIINALKGRSKPLSKIRLETTFAVRQDQKLKTIIYIDEVEKQTQKRIKQTVALLQDDFMKKIRIDLDNINKVFFVGDVFIEPTVKNAFAALGNYSSEWHADSGSRLIINGLLTQTPVVETSTKPEPIAPPPLPPIQKGFKKVEFLKLDSLAVGQKVRLSNNNTDAQKGSLGSSVQLFEYKGNMNFLVLESSRSLAKGDIATSQAPIWVAGIQLELKIERSGRPLGIFKTRTIEKIEVE